MISRRGERSQTDPHGDASDRDGPPIREENGARPAGPLSKTDYVLARLRQEIVEGKMPPGAALRQSELASRFGVSATPVREALRLLEAEGVITYVPHRGATVADLPPESVQHLYMMRSRLEGLACALAVGKIEAENLENIERMHQELEAADADGAHPELARMNRDFHFAIYEVGSTLVAAQIEAIWTMVPLETTLWRTPSKASIFLAQHARIIAAIRARDPDQADALMQDHIMTAARVRKSGDTEVADETADQR